MTRLGFAPDWPAPAGVRARVTERSGGVSLEAYAALNLAAHVGDEPSCVAANRSRLRSALDLPSEPVWLDQVHGSRILDLDGGVVEAADGAVTSRPGVVCAVMTADCLPVLLCDRHGLRVGIAHAGWRGLLNGVLPAAVRAMAVEPPDLLTWLGPAIGPGAYEVGADVRDAFAKQGAAAARCFEASSRGRWQADLYALARLSLEAAGVTGIYGGGFCTFTESERFFSHRREAPCGRMASLIWLGEENRGQTGISPGLSLG